MSSIDHEMEREIGEKYAIAAADMIRRGLPLDACARKLIAAVYVMGKERLVFGPMQATLADADEKLKALTLEVAEMRDDALEAARVEIGTACATQHEWAVREDSMMRAVRDAMDVEAKHAIADALARFANSPISDQMLHPITVHAESGPIKIHACQPLCVMSGKDFVHAHWSQEVTEYFMDQPPATSVATEPPVGVPCSRCGVGQRKHRAGYNVKTLEDAMSAPCSEWRAGNL